MSRNTDGKQLLVPTFIKSAAASCFAKDYLDIMGFLC